LQGKQLRYGFGWVRCPTCRTQQSVELHSFDRHSDPAITSLICDAVVSRLPAECAIIPRNRPVHVSLSGNTDLAFRKPIACTTFLFKELTGSNCDVGPTREADIALLFTLTAIDVQDPISKT
jgi:hypothetical protein